MWYDPRTWFSRESKAMSAYDLSLDLLAEAGSKSGVRVTWETALQASAAVACCRSIAEGIAQVPLKLYRGLENGGAEPATDHPLFSVVSTSPNPWTTSFEWRETSGFHLTLLNRTYALINRSGNRFARRVELLPLTPQQVRVEQEGSRMPRYFVQMEAGKETEVAADRILHLRGPSWNGFEGLDGIKLAREAIGLQLATEEHGARLFKNGVINGGILTTDALLNKEQRDQLRESWDAANAGVANAYRTAVMWGGMKWTPRAQHNDQAQWVEVRRFQIAEVCRFFRVWPLMIGESDKTATYASSEQMFVAHVVHTLMPWYKRIEQRLDMQLLTPEEREAGFFFRFSAQGLMRGAHRDRAEFYSKLYQIGAISPNEIRALEEMNPYEGGGMYATPLNMRLIDEDGEIVSDGNATSESEAEDSADDVAEDDQEEPTT